MSSRARAGSAHERFVPGLDRRHDGVPARRIDTLIVAGVRFYREFLRSELSASDLVHVVGEAEDTAGALAFIRAHSAAVMVLDVGVPGAEEMVRALDSADLPRVVVIGVPLEASEVLHWAELGVWGFVTDNAPTGDIPRAVVAAQRGELDCPPGLAGALLRRVAALASAHDPGGEEPSRELTRRELEIAECLGRGCSNKRIARELGISVATVKNHVHSVLGKLKVDRRAEVGPALRRRWREPTRRHSSHS